MHWFSTTSSTIPRSDPLVCHSGGWLYQAAWVLEPTAPFRASGHCNQQCKKTRSVTLRFSLYELKGTGFTRSSNPNPLPCLHSKDTPPSLHCGRGGCVHCIFSQKNECSNPGTAQCGLSYENGRNQRSVWFEELIG